MKVGTSVVGVDARGATVLTYDDGPMPGATDRILTELAEAGATATFFVLLTRVRRDPGLLREVLAAGHEVGLHGIDHRRLTEMPLRSLPRWLADGRSELEQVTGREVRWFRPPYGAQSPASWRAALKAGMTPVHWSIACQDWLALPLEQHLREVRGRPLAGEVVLLHDGYGDPPRPGDPAPPPIERVGLVRAVLAEIAEQGLAAHSLTDAGGAVRTERRISPEATTRVRARHALGRLRRA